MMNLNEDVREVDDTVDLTEDPFADDLSDQVAAAAPRRTATRTTVVLAGLALLVGGFLAGAQVQKHWGQRPQAANPLANLGGFRPGTAGAGGLAGNGTTSNGTTGNGSSGPATTGTVKLVDGTTVYVQTPDGRVVIVKTSGTTAIQVNRAGSVTDLTAGAPVSVDGQTAADGTVTATRITKTP